MLQEAIEDLGRLKDISVVLARHGFDRIAEKIRGLGEGKARVTEEDLAGAPRRFRLLLQDLGPTFIKLGQILSTRPDILPSAYTEELKVLQDRVDPLPFEAIRKTIEQGLRRPPEEFFESIEDTALASASIAQVHRARLKDGREVVLKVQRPGIEKTIRSDLDLLYLLARVLDATIEESGLYRPVEVVQEFERAIFQELDFLHEAQNAKEFQRNFQGSERVKFPAIVDEATSRSLLCMEYLEGVKISELDREVYDVDRIVDTVCDGLFQMVFVDGFFHGDPHPGNLLVLPDGQVAPLDYGLVGRLSKGMQDNVIQIALAIATRDADTVARLIYRLGSPRERVNLTEFRDQISDLIHRYLAGNLEGFKAGSLIAEMMDLAHRHKIRVRPDLAVLAKASVSIEGVIRSLKPDLDIVATITPYVRRLLLERYGPRSLGESALRQATGFLGSFQDMPLQLSQIMTDLETGRFHLRVANEELDKLSRSLNDLGTKIVLGFLVCGFTIGLFVLLARYPFEIQKVPVWPILAVLVLGGLVTTVFWWHVLYGRIKKVRLLWWINLFRKRKRG